MPKLVSEINSQSYSRSAENGIVADAGERRWKVLLNEPNENVNYLEAIGVTIGQVWSSTWEIPCQSVTVEPDAESRLVKIVTAKYATTPGSDGGDDPGTIEPFDRLAVVTIETAMVEMPCFTWYEMSAGGTISGGRKAATNPAGDVYDGVTKLEPVSIIRVEQDDSTDPTTYCQHIGKVNSNAATWRGLNIAKRTLVFRGLSIRPQTIFFGSVIYRCWHSVYEFAYRRNVQSISQSGGSQDAPCGWDLAVPQTGWNVLEGGVKKRATLKVKINGSDEEVLSGEPVPLDNNGAQTSNVIVNRRGIHDEIDFSQAFAHLRLAPPP